MASKYYFIPYEEKTKINYVYLLYLYSIAQPDKEGLKENGYVDYNGFKYLFKTDIKFNSYGNLESQINNRLKKYQKKDNEGNNKSLVSSDTLKRIVNSNEYKYYFQCLTNEDKYIIILNNNFTNTEGQKKRPFVRLSPAMVDVILEQKDNLLAKYIIYLVHYCGISNNKTDFTANQFLSAIGYSTLSNSQKSKLSSYNRLLEDRKIIKISVWRDEQKHQRNTYSLINYE